MSKAIGIRALARRCGLSTHTLRYYEDAGLMLDVPRDHRGHRAYTDDHERWVRFLVRLRESGMGITTIREYADLTRGAGDPDGSKRLAILRQHRDDVRERLSKLEEHLAVLDGKVAAGCGPSINGPQTTREPRDA